MSKVIVFGASGRSGKYIVSYALEAGHEVTAYVRNPSSLGISDERVHVVSGSITDANQIKKAIQGQDIVVSALGTSEINTDAVNMMSDALSLILPAMKEAGCKRVLAIAGLGVLQYDAETQLLFRADYPAMFYNVGLGHNKVYQLLKDSDMDWTLVCCPYIPDGPRTGSYQLRKDYPAEGKGQINTGDVADCIVHEMSSNKYLRSRVGISN